MVCAPADARVAGGAAALALLGHAEAPCVLVLEWAGGGGVKPPAGRAPVRAARRVAERMEEEVAAVATGRLVHVTLPAAERAAVDVARRHSTRELPSVLVVAGPRGSVIEEALAERDMVLLAMPSSADPDVADLAEAQLAALAPRVRRVALRSSPGAAALARTGMALLSPLRAPFVDALAGREPRRSSPAGYPGE